MTSLAAILRNATVAIVSDNAFARDLMSNAVRQIGAPRIMLLRGAADARDQFGATPPSLVLCDDDDPNTDGIAFTRALRRNDLHEPAATPVILITTRNRPVDVEAARDAGVTEYMMRPFTVGSLAARLESALITPRPFVESAGYIGPCRRRRAISGFSGPYRRESDTDISKNSRCSPERVALAARLTSVRRREFNRSPQHVT